MRRYQHSEANLRDLQRVLSIGQREGRISSSTMLEHANEIARLYNVPLKNSRRFSTDDIQAISPIVDRLVAKHGSKALLSELCSQQSESDIPLADGEERKKDTEEVKEASSMTRNAF